MGRNPAKLALAIHKQLGERDGPVPVADIAYGLDIKSIATKDLKGCEGALITPTNKSNGAIAIKQGADFKRQRFTIAHELGHFINPGHVPYGSKDENGVFRLQCSKKDFHAHASQGQFSNHVQKEIEANRFASELLMPRYKLTPHLRPSPDLRHVIKIANDLAVSREAAANRYVETHDDPIAIVFSQTDKIRYIAKGDDFPRILVWNKQKLPQIAQNANSGPSDVFEAETDVWLQSPTTESLEIQTLGQSKGFQMTLLIGPQTDDEDELGIETSYDRYQRFN